MSEQDMIGWQRGEDGIVVLVIDDPEQSANTMNERYIHAMGVIVDRLEAERESITGVIVTSGKKSFFAGGDLTMLSRATREDAAQVMAQVTVVKDQLRRLEKLGRPVVAAINGTALGGGLEIALACHHRVALSSPRIEIGLPEVTLGLLPGGGGVTRTVRMLGIADALLKVLLQGQRMRPEQAVQAGLVHELADTPAAMMAAARGWIAAHPDAVQPWDVKGYKIPGGTPANPSFAANLPAFPANLRKQLKGADYPAPHHILAAAVEGAQVDVDTAFVIEGRYFVDLVTGPISKNMIKAFFFDLNHVNGGGSRPAGYPPYTARRVAVLGAGMMGAGIAHACAVAGMEVVLKDVSTETAGKGKAHSAALLDKAVARGRMTEQKRTQILDRITPTGNPADCAGADLVIEAVFENAVTKHQVFAEIEPVVAPDALLGSNTSTLPITELAEGVRNQENFVGLHFFSPVDKMPLLEIVRGRRTSDEALARAFDLARQIKKTPVVVNDSRGFFTSRVIGTFLNEAVAMVAEGVSPVSIERAGLQAGYPAPPLQLLDELTLTLPRRIREEARAALRAAGAPVVEHPADPVIDRMVEEFGRTGRSGGAGFYDYGADGTRGRLWPGIFTHFHVDGAEVPFTDIKERMLVIEALETVRCLDEGVLTSVPDANIGSIFGIGFPAWSGGVVQFMNGYPGGLPAFVRRAEELAARYGDRFTPPPSLVTRAS
ncbi:MAG: enoyl-CoA hydratase/isomerase family protein [Actinobacteria bacterium]|nr:enoyl-CoA hydratase/isomerase family protein [Actinomycetota bacterium]MBI3686680.1 enoyl-CoA hydratase/isomerase family protein [Actinomycetota bacterium]